MTSSSPYVGAQRTASDDPVDVAAPTPETSGSRGRTAFDRLQALVQTDLTCVNALIRERMTSTAAPLIPELAAHLVDAGGKRLRPILTLATAQLCGYEGDHHVRLATTVEFIHSATLLHDDVVDDSDQRRGRRTANRLWGNKPSILVGDFLFSRAFQLMVETGSMDVLRTLANASAVIAEGEVLQLSTANTISADDTVYMAVIRAKTAALFEAAAIVGGMIADASAGEQEALRVYGDSLGIAFQLVDDALDYGGVSQRLGKSVGDDFREGKPTLPAILAFAAADAAHRAEDIAFWRRCLERRDQTDADLDRAIALMAETQALAATLARAREHASVARAALEIFPPSPLRAALQDVVDFVIERAA